MKRNRRWTYLLVLLALAAGLYALSPWWSLTGLARAVEEGDRQGMQRYIDFPRVRAGISQQANEYLADKAGTEPGEAPLGALGSMIGAVMVDRAVESLVSPDGLARLMAISKEARRARGEDGGVERKPRPRPQAARDLRERLELHWTGLSSIRVTFFNRKGKLITTGYLERQGLTWRLVDITVPGFEVPEEAAGR